MYIKVDMVNGDMQIGGITLNQMKRDSHILR